MTSTSPCGLMDRAADFESEDCGFESRLGLFNIFYLLEENRTSREAKMKFITYREAEYSNFPNTSAPLGAYHCIYWKNQFFLMR